jgi:hypothetical protein
MALVESHTGLKLQLEEPMADVRMSEDGEAIIVNGERMDKPFVEKPVDGEDHNVYIYFKAGHGRKLFRKASSFTILVQSRSDRTFRLGTSPANWILHCLCPGWKAHTYTKNS